MISSKSQDLHNASYILEIQTLGTACILSIHFASLLPAYFFTGFEEIASVVFVHCVHEFDEWTIRGIKAKHGNMPKIWLTLSALKHQGVNSWKQIIHGSSHIYTQGMQVCTHTNMHGNLGKEVKIFFYYSSWRRLSKNQHPFKYHWAVTGSLYIANSNKILRLLNLAKTCLHVINTRTNVIH